MNEVKFTRAASIDIDRQMDFLLMTRDYDASALFLAALKEKIALIAENPYLGRVYPIDNQYRELVIPFGKKRGYLALYHYEKADNTITIVAVKAAKEQGYTGF